MIGIVDWQSHYHHLLGGGGGGVGDDYVLERRTEVLTSAFWSKCITTTAYST